MEHIELAGIHSGDSACVIPPISIPARHIDTICEYTRKIAVEFNVVGLMNIQYAIANDVVYILEANPRASRTVPLVSKVCNISMARLATQIMLGKKLADLNLKTQCHSPFRRQRSRLPLQYVPGSGSASGTGNALHRRSAGAGRFLRSGFLQGGRGGPAGPSRRGHRPDYRQPRDRGGVLEVARAFMELGFKIKATNGTHRFLAEQGVEAEPILKMHEGRPNIVDAIKNEEIQLVINTPSGKLSKYDDSYIRKAAIKYKIPYITTIAAAIAAAKGIAAFRKGHGRAKSLQSYHADIK